MVGDFSLLNVLIWLPLIGVAVITCGISPRSSAVSVGVLMLGLALYLAYLMADAGEGMQFRNHLPVVPSLGLAYAVGADGLSILLALLTAVISLAAFGCGLAPEARPRLYYICLLLISAGCMGAFLSTDLFFFYAFHELALIPTFLLIGIWGHGNKSMAAWRTTIYLGLGSFVLLIGLLALVVALPAESRTMDMVRLSEEGAVQKLDADVQSVLYLLLLIGFGTLVSLVPFHSWAPQAYASAPSPAAMLHAGVLKKFGLYGLLRIAHPLLPEGAAAWSDLLLILLCLNVVYMGFVTIAQRKLDQMLGHSSVMHMGYIFLGVACVAHTPLGAAGATVLMLAHGLAVALLFGLAGDVRDRRGTLEFRELSGLAKNFPVMGLTFGIGAFASIGLPGLGNFVGELMVFAAGFKAAGGVEAFNLFHVAVIACVFGVLLSAIYMLRAYGAIFMGPATEGKPEQDLRLSARLLYALLIGALLVMGFYPALVTDLLLERAGSMAALN